MLSIFGESPENPGPIRQTTLDIPHGGMRSLFASANGTSLGDVDLRSRLASWTSEVENVVSSEVVVNREIEKLRDRAFGVAFFPLQPAQEELLNVRKRIPPDERLFLADSEIATGLVMAISIADAAIRYGHELKREAETIVGLLDRHLAR